jgi:ankyrin repeat protein
MSQFFRLLLEQRADNGAIPAGALLYAIEHSFDVSFMRTLIKLRANVNLRASDGMSALMEVLASSYPPHNSLCPLLLEHRADVNIVDQHGRSALIWASAFGNEECNILNIPLLLKARADIDVMDQGTFPFPPPHSIVLGNIQESYRQGCPIEEFGCFAVH